MTRWLHYAPLWYALGLIVMVLVWLHGAFHGLRVGRKEGISEGYGMCLKDRRYKRSDMFSRFYGGPDRRSYSDPSS